MTTLSPTESPPRWTDPRVAQLRDMLECGQSASQIGAALKISHNAVIGKVHRMGLKFSRAPNQHFSPTEKEAWRAQARIRNAKRRERDFRPKPPAFAQAAALDLPPDQSPEAVSLLDATAHQCRWPLTDPGPGFLFCGAEKVPGYHYCGRHCRLAYNRGPHGHERPDFSRILRKTTHAAVITLATAGENQPVDDLLGHSSNG